MNQDVESAVIPVRAGRKQTAAAVSTWNNRFGAGCVRCNPAVRARVSIITENAGNFPVKHFPVWERNSSACIHRLYGLEGAIRGIRKNQLPDDVKAELKEFYREMK